jgi:hypothetical protein
VYETPTLLLKNHAALRRSLIKAGEGTSRPRRDPILIQFLFLSNNLCTLSGRWNQATNDHVFFQTFQFVDSACRCSISQDILGVLE